MFDFIAVAQMCAPLVDAPTLSALVKVESSYNPYAIGVVGGHLARQPKTLDEALTTVAALKKDGWNFSLGLAQVNRDNLTPYQLSVTDAFDACKNLSVGAQIFNACLVRAKEQFPTKQLAEEAAYSCYYSGNFTRGFQADKPNEPSYVQKVLAANEPIPVIKDASPQKTTAPKNTSSITLENPVLLQTVTTASSNGNNNKKTPTIVEDQTNNLEKPPVNSTIVF